MAKKSAQLTAAAPTAPGKQSKRPRVALFGPRSLTARLLVVLLVPTSALGVFAYHDVADRTTAASDAARISDQISLLQDSERLLAPLYTEYNAALGLRLAESVGLSNQAVYELVGIDFISMVTSARIQLDSGLDQIVASHGTERLHRGETIAEEVAQARDQLRATREALDGGHLLSVDLEESYGVLVDLVDDVAIRSREVFTSSSSGDELAQVATETTAFEYSLQYVTQSLNLIVASSTMSTDATPLYDLVASAGAFRSSLDRLGDRLSPQRAAELDALRAKPSFAAVDKAETEWVLALADVVMAGKTVATDRVAMDAITALLLASFERLGDLQTYGDTFLAQEMAIALDLQHDAAHARQAAVIWMASAVGMSLLLLGLVAASVLRPVRTLVRHSHQVRQGDLDVQAVRPTGPTDIRTLTQTFNEMVITLRAFDAQVQRLARGEAVIERPLPGPLGLTLRESVDRLAEVTQQLHESEAAATIQARTDALTGLANRTAVLDRLAEIGAGARATGLPGAIVYLDLDGFKNVNDTQGHGAGDRVLRQIGLRLRNACPNDMVARMGGDEFIVLIEQAGPIERVEAFAVQLIRLASEPCEARDGQQFTLTASAGVTLVDGECQPLECIAQADSAVYRAKEQGRSRVEAYDERLAAEIETRSEMALNMRRGLEENEFTLHFQPIISLADDRPVGVEALLRWTLPDGREISPVEFIPIAERTGLIVAVDEWVIDHALLVLRDWQDDPALAPLSLAINISGRHMSDGSLPSLLAAKCGAAGVDPRRLGVEITETYLMADSLRSRVVDELRELGIVVAIDDFGTGYSSMSSLHELAADTIKIDQVFVSGLTRRQIDRTIVELVLRLAESLDMDVIAEGVDSEEKLARLQELGCNKAQGFHIALPMDLATCTHWLRERVQHFAVPG